MPRDQPSKPLTPPQRRVVHFSARSFWQIAQYLKSFRNHVARHLLCAMSKQRVGVQGIAVSRNHKRFDGLPESFIWNADYRCATQLAALEKDLLDFGGTNAKSTGLDHRVAPADEVQKTVLIHLYEVTS